MGATERAARWEPEHLRKNLPFLTWGFAGEGATTAVLTAGRSVAVPLHS